jgi:hypothetical protein
VAVTSIRLCFANDAAGRWDAKASELPSHGRETEGLDCPIERRVEGCVAIVEEEPRAPSRRYRTIYVDGTPYIAGIHFKPVLEVLAPLFERPG